MRNSVSSFCVKINYWSKLRTILPVLDVMLTCNGTEEEAWQRRRTPARAQMSPTRLLNYTIGTSGKCLLPLYWLQWPPQFTTSIMWNRRISLYVYDWHASTSGCWTHWKVAGYSGWLVQHVSRGLQPKTSMRRRPQMLGTHTSPIQIDEARFAGRRKYNRGCILQGDYPPQEWDADVAVENQRNHGNRVDGPWVFGLKQNTDVRYFHVVRRDRNTLLPIIQRECAPGSVIHSDEWPAYATLNTLGFDHYTVNHQQVYVNPVTGAHT